jgi:hypothetical protein
MTSLGSALVHETGTVGFVEFNAAAAAVRYIHWLATPLSPDLHEWAYALEVRAYTAAASAYPDDCVVLNAADSRQYRNNEGTWDVAGAKDTISGLLTASDIVSVSASTINGLIIAAQISTVSASTINGQIVASQISTISASSITGSIVSSQIASVSANCVYGQIIATQISQVSASSITGEIVASQISTVAASSISGLIAAGQIGGVNASLIAGTIVANQISTVYASSLSGTIVASQISTISASTISGTIVASQIASVNASQINVGTMATGGLSAGLGIGYGSALTITYPGSQRFYNAAGANTILIDGISANNRIEILNPGLSGGIVLTGGASPSIGLYQTTGAHTIDLDANSGDIYTYGAFDFRGTFTYTVGASAGYARVKVSGVQRWVRVYFDA